MRRLIIIVLIATGALALMMHVAQSIGTFAGSL